MIFDVDYRDVNIRSTNVVVNGVSYGESVADWYIDRGHVYHMMSGIYIVCPDNYRKQEYQCWDGTQKYTYHTESDDTHRTSDEEQTIYERIDHQHRLADARRHVAETLKVDDDASILEQFDYEELVESFEDNYDCNVAENDVWQSVIGEYIYRMKH